MHFRQDQSLSLGRNGATDDETAFAIATSLARDKEWRLMGPDKEKLLGQGEERQRTVRFNPIAECRHCPLTDDDYKKEDLWYTPKDILNFRFQLTTQSMNVIAYRPELLFLLSTLFETCCSIAQDVERRSGSGSGSINDDDDEFLDFYRPALQAVYEQHSGQLVGLEQSLLAHLLSSHHHQHQRRELVRQRQAKHSPNDDKRWRKSMNRERTTSLPSRLLAREIALAQAGAFQQKGHDADDTSELQGVVINSLENLNVLGVW